MIKQSKTREITNIVLFVLFILFALLQLNDPDPVLWVVIYSFIACIPLISNYKVIPKTFLWIVLGALLVYAASYFSYLVDWMQTENKEELFGEMVYDKPYLEGTREFLGLIIAALAIALLLFRKK